jgi:ankyrin repeat protein
MHRRMDCNAPCCIWGTVRKHQGIVQVGGDLNLRGAHGKSPLHNAVRSTHPESIEAAKELCQLGADIHLVDDLRMKAIDVAKKYKKLEMVKVLQQLDMENSS